MTATYLYCILHSPRKPSLSRVPAGLPDATSPHLVPCAASLWLVVADVPLRTYGAGSLDEHLSDLEWVGRVAMAHEQVVEHFARKPSTTVIPMKLFTMFSTLQRAIEDVAARRSTILAMARRISGAQEWGVRVTQMPGGTRGRPASGQTPRSGAAFLAHKKEARDSAHSAKAAAAESALNAYERLSKLARETRLRQDAPSSAATPPILDAAFLVPSSKRGRFTEAAKREAAACAKAGVQMTLTGPWPAYNFVNDGAARR